MTKAAYRRKDLFLLSFPELESVMAGRAGRVVQEAGGQVLNCKHEVEGGATGNIRKHFISKPTPSDIHHQQGHVP